MRFNQSVFPI
jgi:hypothetical protein